jgi:hypothetical protein
MPRPGAPLVRGILPGVARGREDRLRQMTDGHLSGGRWDASRSPSASHPGYTWGMDERKPATGFWMSVALGAMLALYPLSFGPVCWTLSGDRESRLLRAYAPVARLAADGPHIVSAPLICYARIGKPHPEELSLPTTVDGDGWTTWRFK